jgi:hypothetical protein
MNGPELGARIDPGMGFNPFPSSIWIRRDLNPQPLDCEFSSLTTRPDLRPPNFSLATLLLKLNFGFFAKCGSLATFRLAKKFGEIDPRRKRIDRSKSR